MRLAGAVWADAVSRSRLTIIRANTDPCSILNQVQAISNAGVIYNWDGPQDGAIGAAVAAPFEGVKQWAQLTYQTAAGALIRLTVPAPKLAIFKADRQTVDPTQIAALTAACLAQLVSPSGALAVGYVGGVLMPDRSDLSPLGF